MEQFFFDSTDPELIPAHRAACLYYDGDYAVAQPVPAYITARFTAIRWITVLGDYEHCGIADFEKGNQVFGQPGKLRAWVQGRIDMQKRARVYCDRDNVPLVQMTTAGLVHEWWIGTLDGNKLTAGFLPDMWGVQYLGNNRYDESVLYGAW